MEATPAHTYPDLHTHHRALKRPPRPSFAAVIEQCSRSVLSRMQVQRKAVEAMVPGVKRDMAWRRPLPTWHAPRTNDLLTDRPTDRPTTQPTIRPSDHPTIRPTIRPTDRLTGRPTD